MNENVFSLGVMLWQVLNLLLTAAIFVFLGWRVWQVLRRRKRMTRVAADSLAERIRVHRQRCRMTQEFVAESLGVSRQAVSKWESGAAKPSTANLLALAKLFNVDAAEMLKSIQ